MSLHPYFNQFCFRNVYQISRSIKKKTVFHCVPYLKIQITLLHKTFIAFIPITKFSGVLVSKEFQIFLAKGITSMPCRKSYFVVGPFALNCPMYLPEPRDFPGCSETTGFVRMTPYQGFQQLNLAVDKENHFFFVSFFMRPVICCSFCSGFFVHAFGVLNLSTISSLSLVIALPTRQSLETN